MLAKADVAALDGKMNFDDNAAFRHKTWAELLDREEENPVELEAADERGVS